MAVASITEGPENRDDGDERSPVAKPLASHGRRAPPDGSSPWAFAWPAVLFSLITFFVGADMAADLSDGVSLTHLVLETIAFFLCLTGAGGTALQLRAALRRARELQRDLEGTRADLEGTRADLVRWREEAKDLLGGLRGAIDRKAGLANRAEMAAFFLEDFLVPPERRMRERGGAGEEHSAGAAP